MSEFIVFGVNERHISCPTCLVCSTSERDTTKPMSIMEVPAFVVKPCVYCKYTLGHRRNRDDLCISVEIRSLSGGGVSLSHLCAFTLLWKSTEQRHIVLTLPSLHCFVFFISVFERRLLSSTRWDLFKEAQICITSLWKK